MKKSVKKVFNSLGPICVCALLIASCTNAKETDSDSSSQDVSQDSISSLTLVWKTDSILTGSESTLYNPDDQTIYVSCGNTDPVAKDGDGFIALLNPDGTIKQKDWVTGLHAPKGMAILNGKLYVTDIDEVKIIDIKEGKVEKTIPVAGSVFLNDLASDGKAIYFSDSRTGMIHSLDADGNLKVVVENATGINGLEFFDGSLYTLDGEGLKKYDADYKPELLNSDVTGGDGLVILNDSTFIASRWAGEIYVIQGKNATLLIDTKEDKSNTADIGYIADKRLVLVPTFMKNEVAAYSY